MNRRDLLVGALALGSGGLVAALRNESTFGYDGLEVLGEDVAHVTPNERFYVVTKNLVDPRVKRSRWRLEVTGLVTAQRTLDLEGLAALRSVEQETTLECISNPVGGGLISNAVWTGVPLRDVIERARPDRRARRVFFHASDGYTHSISLEGAMEPSTLLAHTMNGEPLPDRHGFPVRLLVPGAYGEVSVKWLDRIELVADDREGYYERQGWRAERVHTMARIDVPARGGLVRGSTRIRGIAFAGDRGISKVEVSVDGGESWRRARIDYHPSRLAWAHWSVDWVPRPGEGELVVRATDGRGSPQETEVDDQVPDGATGLHRLTVRSG